MMREAAILPSGLRAWGLVIVGAIWVWIGVGVWAGASQPPVGVGLWHLLLPPYLRAFLWVLSGAAALGAARWSSWDQWALMLLVVMPLVRLTSYASAWVLWLIPGQPDGLRSGWYSTAFYVLMLSLVVLIACIPRAMMPVTMQPLLDVLQDDDVEGGR